MDDQNDPVELYALGLICASACAPKDMDREAVERSVNSQHPTGIRSRWCVADEPFRTGEPNPCPCNDHPEERLHWLLVC